MTTNRYHPFDSRDALIETAEHVISPATRISFPELILSGGQGARIWEDEQRPLIDLHSMASVMNIGYNHPRVLEVLSRHAKNFVHANTAYVMHKSSILLAQKLLALLPPGVERQVAFGHSGSDGMDGAIKLARAATGKQRIITFRNAYHGNTYGALSVSSASAAMRDGFEPSLPKVSQVDFPLVSDHSTDAHSASPEEILREIRRIVDTHGDVAGIVVEPIQGDSGVWLPPPGFLDAVKAIMAENGALFIADEVQTGLGRTGRMFASEAMELFPDILVLGKALGGGLPISAIIAPSTIMEAWAAPGHVFSTVSNPLISEVAMEVLDIIADEHLVARSAELGEHVRSSFTAMMRRISEIIDVRGSGLMVGVHLDLTGPHGRLLPAKVIKYCLDHGLYLTFLAGSVLRIIPPLTIGREELDDAVAIIEAAFAAIGRGEISDEDVEAFAGW